MLEIATDSIVVTTNTYMQKKWDLQGGTDPYIWTFGHDLQLGFIDIDDNPINFKLLNTFYSLIVKVNII